MTQLTKRRPANPKQAAACCGPIDDLLDPALFKALGDPTRVRLLGCLAKCGRGCTVGEVAECCSVDFSVVSRHLALLERAGILESSKQGKSVVYIVRYEPLSKSLHALADAILACGPAGAATTKRGACCD
jgi:ArsR family transcriptional regulator